MTNSTQPRQFPVSKVKRPSLHALSLNSRSVILPLIVIYFIYEDVVCGNDVGGGWAETCRNNSLYKKKSYKKFTYLKFTVAFQGLQAQGSIISFPCSTFGLAP